MDQGCSTLIVLGEGCHARDVDAVLANGARDSVLLSADPTLVMRLRRAGYHARLTVDGLNTEARLERDTIAIDAAGRAFGDGARDYSTLGGTSYRSFLAYTLLPPFIRTIRNLSAVLDTIEASGTSRLVVVGHGDLARAALLVAAQRALTVRRLGGSLASRLADGVRRIWDGRHTRWVNTDFRAFVLEPAYLAVLALAGLTRLGRRHRAGRHTPTDRPTWLFTGDRFTHDLAGSMERDAELILAGATQPGRALFRHSGYGTLEEFGTPADALDTFGHAVVCAVRALRLLTDSAQHQRFAYRRINYWTLVRRPIALHLAVWPAQLAHVGRLARRLASARQHVRLLVSNHVTAYNRMLIASGRDAGWVSVGIQHGILSESNGHSAAEVDLMLVWGDASIEWYHQHGPQHSRFAVTGNPRFDELARRATPGPRPGGDSPFTIVVCTGFVSEYSVAATEYENLLLIETAIAWARTRRNVRVVHKAHPGEELSYYRRLAAELGWTDAFFSTVQQSPSLHDLLVEADVLLAGYSTTVLEAVALGAQVIVLDAIAQMHAVPLDECPAVTIADTVKMCHERLDTLVVGATRARTDPRVSQPFLRRYLSELDGHAAERVVRQLQDVIGVRDRAAWHAASS